MSWARQISTIRVSDELRKRIKMIAAERDVSYEELLNDFIELYDGIINFKNEDEFRKWFETHLSDFGFKSIEENNYHKTPDYILKDFNNKNIKVEIELLDSHFILHKHDVKDVDIIICAYSKSEFIKKIPVLALFKGYPFKQLLLYTNEEENNIVVRYSKKWGMSKADTIKKIIREFEKDENNSD